ncbi:tRNA 2-thiouridine(34) synthase MnmA [Candidatus Falkowbacteria bacterium]|nr:tRNA 2-thiouridine(34) synthase MnmA [Candidatus Falkowbacteria bacterium]
MFKKKQKVAIAMSGGVDSSVAAALLKKQGLDVVGIFMHFWSDPHYAPKQTIANKCCSIDAETDARRVAERLNIPIYTINLDNNFKKYIVDNFLDEYKRGRTPNPCVRCNQFIKFGEFWIKAKSLGCDFIATGHYTQIKKDKNGFHLLEAKDKSKDQSYFLYRLNQKILSHCLFPLGDYKKEEIRKIAQKLKLPVFAKKDSQEVCFIKEKTPAEFLKRYLKPRMGEIITTGGKVMGKHLGLPYYTIGQRKGLGLSGGPWYVINLNVQKNQLIITDDPGHSVLFNDIMYVSQINWINNIPKMPVKVEIKIRSMNKKQSGIIRKEKNSYQIKFKNKQRAITPGQSAVFYKKDEVLGGGIIIKK